MSEFDIFSAGDDLFRVFQSPQPTDITPSALSSTIPLSTTTPSSISAALSSATSAGMPQTPDQSISTGGVVLRQRRNPGTGSGIRGSFYASGTISACGSRDTSPTRFAPLKRTTPYPVPPPSMIISPSKPKLRAPSGNRGGRTFSQTEVELLHDMLKNVDKDATREGLSSVDVKVETRTDENRLEKARPPKVELETNLEKGKAVEYAPLETSGFIRSSDYYHSLNRTKDRKS